MPKNFYNGKTTNLSKKPKILKNEALNNEKHFHKLSQKLFKTIKSIREENTGITPEELEKQKEIIAIVNELHQTPEVKKYFSHGNNTKVTLKTLLLAMFAFGLINSIEAKEISANEIIKYLGIDIVKYDLNTKLLNESDLRQSLKRQHPKLSPDTIEKEIKRQMLPKDYIGAYMGNFIDTGKTYAAYNAIALDSSAPIHRTDIHEATHAIQFKNFKEECKELGVKETKQEYDEYLDKIKTNPFLAKCLKDYHSKIDEIFKNPKQREEFMKNLPKYPEGSYNIILDSYPNIKNIRQTMLCDLYRDHYKNAGGIVKEIKKDNNCIFVIDSRQNLDYIKYLLKSSIKNKLGNSYPTDQNVELEAYLVQYFGFKNAEMICGPNIPSAKFMKEYQEAQQKRIKAEEVKNKGTEL